MRRGAADDSHQTVPFDTDFVSRLRGTGVDVAGSLYAVPADSRAAAAALLSQNGMWLHADVFPDNRMGVSVDLISELAESGCGPLDVHLLAEGSMTALVNVCRPGVTRVTFPYEGTDDIQAVAAQVRAAGAQPWLAIAPDTAVDVCHDALSHVDGLLVMLIKPGTREAADLGQLRKVQAVSKQQSVGVDGGVHEANFDRIVAAGATYVVAGRRLFTVPPGLPQRGQR